MGTILMEYYSCCNGFHPIFCEILVAVSHNLVDSVEPSQTGRTEIHFGKHHNLIRHLPCICWPTPLDIDVNV